MAEHIDLSSLEELDQKRREEKVAPMSKQEAADHYYHLQLEKIRDRIRAGGTTGDHIRDLGLLHYRGYGEDVLRNYRRLDQLVRGHVGQPVLVEVYDEGDDIMKSLIGPSRGLGKHQHRLLLVGVISEQRLLLAHEIGLEPGRAVWAIPTKKHVRSGELPFTKEARQLVVEGSLYIPSVTLSNIATDYEGEFHFHQPRPHVVFLDEHSSEEEVRKERYRFHRQRGVTLVFGATWVEEWLRGDFYDYVALLESEFNPLPEGYVTLKARKNQLLKRLTNYRHDAATLANLRDAQLFGFGKPEDDERVASLTEALEARKKEVIETIGELQKLHFNSPVMDEALLLLSAAQYDKKAAR